VRLLEEHLANLVDYEFTAQMEDFLDDISRHEKPHVDYLHKFFFGNDTPGLKQRVESKIKEVDARDISRFSLGQPESGEHQDEVFVRVGKFGPFLEQGDRRASIPHDMPPDELTLKKAVELLDQGQTEDQPLGICPDTGKPVYLKTGRFGPYVQLGSADDDEKPKNASLMKGMTPEDVDLQTALRLLSLPRTLGDHPQQGEPVIAQNGRFGPFVKCGSETRSLPEGLSPLDVTLEQALELLAKPKTRGRQASRSKEPLKVLGPSPVTEQPVRVLDGRYGTYVTDGETNATLPKDAAPDEVTMEFALELLATRAAQPSRGKKKMAKSAKAKKKTTKKAKKKSSKKA
jgi:DNA topoisomerase-1